ncbi:AcrR family transcriptional regulator [Pseudonocardia parietis]|uniref:AcrR family transcriptional regulator n=1 Tax=Pseudonocardia parietis TaxID=570936 RepID=A0ABS4VKI0_9PSEU|nr:AcrR family transcriptional regulator [Pseudonocardia parietis]
MVKRQDPDTRRATIADAVGRTIAHGAGGFPGMREIAAEAGVTTGALQHHFRTKDEMLLFALEHHGRRWADRLHARADRPGPPAPPRRVLEAVVEELLPLDDERTAEAAVAIAFTLRAATRPALAEHYRRQRAFLHELVAAQFARAAVTSPAAAADLLLHALDGMRTDCLVLGPGSVSVEALLDRLLPPAAAEQ